MKRKLTLLSLLLIGLATSCVVGNEPVSSSDLEDSGSGLASSEVESGLSSSLLESSESDASSNVSTSGGGSSSYWAGLDMSKIGNAFRGDLQALIKTYKTKTATYSQCLSIGASAASYPKGSSSFVPFYHASPDVTEGVSGNGVLTVSDQKLCNREHTWPNSRGSGKEGGPGNDPFITRPTLYKDNSSRGNKFYGYASTSEWDPASYGYEGARGEAARVILYAATAYYGTCGSGGSSKGSNPLELSNNPDESTLLHTMGTLKTLLQWNSTYAPSAIEIQVNDYLCEKGYGRNPFVDEPSYANQIWDESGVREA